MYYKEALSYLPTPTWCSHTISFLQAFTTVVQAEDEENEGKQKNPDKLLQYPCLCKFKISRLIVFVAPFCDEQKLIGSSVLSTFLGKTFPYNFLLGILF